MPATTASYSRLSAVYPDLRISAGPPRGGTGWTTAEELAGGGRALAAFVARDTARLTRDHGRPPRPDVAATLALHRYLWPACLLFTVPWFLHRRVPRLPVGDVSFHRSTGRMTVRTRAFSCLPDDPAARLPGASAVRSRGALREELRAALAEHAGPVLESFGPLLRRGPHALWGMVTDEITEGLWYVGRLLGQEERAVAELAALLPGGTAPYAGAADFRPGTRIDGPPHGTADGSSVDAPSGGTSRKRLTCCLFYTVSPTDTCATCPRTCGAQRIGRPVSAA
jgi:hypothetical protein